MVNPELHKRSCRARLPVGEKNPVELIDRDSQVSSEADTVKLLAKACPHELFSRGDPFQLELRSAISR